MATIINASTTALTVTPDTSGALTIQTNGSNALQITANGQITTANAPFILTGGQLQFPATQIASGDANCLDDYEEGTFTPIFKGSGSNPTPTYHTQSGKYTKIGRLVEVEIYLRFTAYSGGSGAPQIGGLPFTSSSSVNAFLVWGESTGFTLGGTYYNIVAEVDTNATTATLLKGAPNAATTSMAFSEVGTATTVYMLVSGCYTTT